jgi:MtrB/PioB family decaheme-associated outer membrane protein
MKRKQCKHLFRLSCVAAALAGAYGPAMAQTVPEDRAEAVAAIAASKSEFRLGGAYVSDDNRRFGQYSGLRDKGLYAIVDLNVVSLDKITGTWTKFSGRNLGLDSREMLFDVQRQGDWRYFLGFSQTARYEPYVVNTGLTGIGTNSVAVNGAGVRPVNLEMNRDLFSAGFDQQFGGTYGVRVRYTHEDKEGARLYGRGTTGSVTFPTAIEFLTEPISRSTQTLEATLSHTGQRFQINGGYYGTLFVNHVERLDITNTGTSALDNTYNGIPPFSPMSMPLSNDSHQLFVTGGYSVTPLTRASFKGSYTTARQNENFIAVSSPLAGAPSSLNGRVDTTLAYFDLTSVEFDRLDLQANVRYEDRDDKTPLVQYLTITQPSTGLAGSNGVNKPRSWSSAKGKLEAGYQMPLGFKLVGGWEYDHQTRKVPDLGSCIPNDPNNDACRRINFRESNDEATTRVEIKRMIAESLSGSVAYSHAKRTGSDYFMESYVPTGTSIDINPLLFADRDRDSWRMSFDWSPLDELAMHLAYDHSQDEYSGKPFGPREGKRGFYTLDASYALTNRWQANLWVSRDDTHADQTTQTGAGQRWAAHLRHLGEGVGGGVRGKLKRGFELGADFSRHRERAEQQMQALTGTAITSLPDYEYKLTEVKLFGGYAIDASSGVRLDYLYQDWRSNDWQWAGWVYSDGTTVTQAPVERTHYLGATYYVRWR